MNLIDFNHDNTNVFTIKYQEKINFTYHINEFEYPYFHAHSDYWEFTIVTKGSIINQIDKDSDTCDLNSLVITPTNVNHRVLKNKNNPQMRYINIIFREAKIKEICETLNPKLFDFLKSKNKPIHLPKYIIDECENIIHYIRLLKNDEIDRYEELLSSIVILILHHLIIHMDVEEEENSWIKNFQKLTQDAEFPRYNVDDLCRKTKYSRMQLNRLMAEHLNATPSQYLLEYKLNYAERLLITTDTPISTISEMVGYSSQSTFIKNFKKKFGLSPYQYRKLN